MNKLELTQKSLPVCLRDFDKFFETEIVYLGTRDRTKVLLIKSRSGVIGPYWLNEFATYYSCAIDKRGLLILSLLNLGLFAKVFGVTIDKQ